MSQLSASGKLNFTADDGPSQAWLAFGTTPGPGSNWRDAPFNPPEKPANDRLGKSSDTTGRGRRCFSMYLQSGYK
ncbi:uncharacterized protein CTRU02_214178 [Colletotrichum truncatum]|uniref:Uncharacterized protein n=1 Tax=Colletotrichum truncatum TaxID=5467 RepID=A0ACC3YHQ6_COLTU|nr:uncharacterized protein CTRU02_11258 [Colletotrichum truncatum]KAF6786000.1 hypothetical protein CTRU02_11258 [Colletotrichum truncatum]